MSVRGASRYEKSSAVAIIGAGATGACVFCNLVKRNTHHTYYIFDSRFFQGGLAFGTDNDTLLCNTPNNLNSIFYDEPDDFVDYLYAGGFNASGEGVSPRRLFAQYFTTRLKQAIDTAIAGGASVHLINSDVKHITKGVMGRYFLHAEGQVPVMVRDIIDCRGFNTPYIPDWIKPFETDKCIIRSPFPENGDIQQVQTSSRVLVLGTGLSAIDATLLLAKRNCTIVMASRSGELPSVKNAVITAPGRYILSQERNILLKAGAKIKIKGYRILLNALRRYSELPRSKQVARNASPIQFLRDSLAVDKKNDNHWKELLVEFYETLNSIGAQLSGEDRKHMLQAFKPLIGKYISSFPAENAREILRLMEANQLQVRKCNTAGIARIEDTWTLHWTDGTYSRFDYIVCATGFDKPKLYETKDGYSLQFQPHLTEVLSVSKEQQVVNSRSGSMERIWCAGATAHWLQPLPLYFSAVAKQAMHLAVFFARAEPQLS